MMDAQDKAYDESVQAWIKTKEFSIKETERDLELLAEERKLKKDALRFHKKELKIAISRHKKYLKELHEA